MTVWFARDEHGQALIVVGLAMVVLMGALGLALDWGHGYVLRRDLQNQADALTLAAARYAASTYTTSGAFEAQLGDICWDIKQRTSLKVDLAFFSEASAGDASLWTTISTTDGGCVQGAGGVIPADARFVRARIGTTYASIFSPGSLGVVAVGASARARLTAGAAMRPLQLPAGATEQPGAGLSGATTLPNVAIWPIALHFDPTTLEAGACGQFCDTSSRLLTLWRSNGRASEGFGGFQQLVTFSHESVHNPTVVHQLITESDYRGTAHGGQGHPATPPLANATAQLCPNVPPGSWDTNGARSQANAARCDLPNWFYYGYGGSISLGTRWSSGSWSGYRGLAAVPSALSPSRSSCLAAPNYFPTPSCEAAPSTRGDWIEALNDGTNSEMTQDMALRMREFVERYGRDVQASVTMGWGKAVVVHVFLWDCAEHFDTTSGTWTLIEHTSGAPASCADITDADARSSSADRVHVFTSVPLTFFENLIDPGGPHVQIQALWGDVFGEPAFYLDGSSYVSCTNDPSRPACDLGPLMNSAFLVPDE